MDMDTDAEMDTDADERQRQRQRLMRCLPLRWVSVLFVSVIVRPILWSITAGF